MQELIDKKLRDLHAAVYDVRVMFGASQLKTWIERSPHASVYQSNGDDMDNVNFPFTLTRCLIILGFEDAYSQTEAEKYSHKKYTKLFGSAVSGAGKDNFTTSAHGSADNPLSVYAVVCAKHITPAIFQQKRDKCKNRFSEYRKQLRHSRFSRSCDVWARHYAPAVREMFNHSANQTAAKYGPLKYIHKENRRQLAEQPDATIPTVYESQEF